MTRWVNLGPGLTQEDPMRKTHVYLTLGGRGRLDGDDPEHSLAAHSPRLCFEDIASQSFEDLQSRNLSYLRDQQHKNAMPLLQQDWTSGTSHTKSLQRKGELDPCGTWYAVRLYLEKMGPSWRELDETWHYDSSSPSNRLSWASLPGVY